MTLAVESVTLSGWPDVLLLALNVTQTLALAWLASRGTRRRASDQ